MITPSEEDYIRSYAYLPEHLPNYVSSISGAEPSLINDYLLYHGKGYMTFIGYPLNGPKSEEDTHKILDHAIEQFRPEYVSLIAPVTLISRKTCNKSSSDYYYRLDLFNLNINKKLRNMLKRASRELSIEINREITDEHLILISEFLDSHRVDDETRYIFERIPRYISSSPTAIVFCTRDKAKRLVSFDIAEFGAKDYAFYMFNFMSQKQGIPGASDLLLYEVIRAAQEQGKLFLNLGLGISEGVTFFKKKWGGVPFLRYEFCFYQRDDKTKKLKTLLEIF